MRAVWMNDEWTGISLERANETTPASRTIEIPDSLWRRYKALERQFSKVQTEITAAIETQRV